MYTQCTVKQTEIRCGLMVKLNIIFNQSVKLTKLIILKNGHCLGSLEIGFRLCSDGASQAILSRWRSTRVLTANTSGIFFFKSKTRNPWIPATVKHGQTVVSESSEKAACFNKILFFNLQECHQW